VENLALSGVRMPYRPAFSDSLCRLRYPGARSGFVGVINSSHFLFAVKYFIREFIILRSVIFLTKISVESTEPWIFRLLSWLCENYFYCCSDFEWSME
jgi:hypothetical protein